MRKAAVTRERKVRVRPRLGGHPLTKAIPQHPLLGKKARPAVRVRLSPARKITHKLWKKAQAAAKVKASFQKRMIRRAQDKKKPAPKYLTPSLVRTAKLVAKGLNNAEAAEKLQISPNTVRNNVAELFRRLRVKSRKEITVELIRRGS